MNYCVFIRNINIIDYLKIFNLKDIRRVFNKMIYKENGREICKFIFYDYNEKNNYVIVNVFVKYNFIYIILKLVYCFIKLFDVFL